MEPAPGPPAAAGAPFPGPTSPPSSFAPAARPAVARAASSLPAMLELGALSSSSWSDGDARASTSSSSDSDGESDTLQEGDEAEEDDGKHVTPVRLERRRRRELRTAQSADAFYRLPSLGAAGSSQRRTRQLRGSLLATMAVESDPCLLAANESDSLSSLDELSSSTSNGDFSENDTFETDVSAQHDGHLRIRGGPSEAPVRVVVVQPIPDITPSSALSSSSSSSSSTSSVLERSSTADREMLTLMRRTELLRASSASKASAIVNHPVPAHTPSPTANGGNSKSQKKVRRSRSGAVRAWLSRTVTQRTLRKLSAVRNSYFAFWLVNCSLAVVACELLAILIVHFLYHPRYHEKPLGSSESGSAESSSGKHHGDPYGDACGGRLLLTMHLVGAPNVMLLAPVVFPSSALVQLYMVRDRRMVRRPYLLLCELIIALQLAFMMFFAVRQVLNVPAIVRCHARAQKHELAMFYSSLVVWLVLLRQIVVFARFLTHIKLQADGADDSAHTSSIGNSGALWHRIVPSCLISARRKRRREITSFKKQLYRSAARGDVIRTARLLSRTRQQKEEEDGENHDKDAFLMTEQELRKEYTAPRLWLGAFARSRKNPLHVAVMRGHLPVVQVLLAHGFDPNALDKVARVNFNLALIFKLCSRMLIETQDRRRSIVRALFCSVLLPSLHGAVAAGYVHVVRELIDHGADVNIRPRASFYYRQAELPPIFVADDPQVLQLLVSHGANFLHVAAVALSGSTPRKRRMLATPLQQSAFTLRSDLSEFLIECGGDVALTPLHAAAARDDERAITKLLAARHSILVDTRGERVAGVFRRTPLHWAAIAGSLKAATLLLDRGADPNARDRDGRTPLHWAARNNRPEIVSLLIHRGADPNAVDSTVDQLPVVCFAAEAEDVSVHVFASLARAGASLHTQVAARGGDTALHIALQRENRQTALSLIKCGANMMTTNSLGKRAVDCTTSTELQFFLKREAGSRKIMISYTHSHFQLAQRVREYLETREQLTCWLDTMDPSGIGGGAVWREEIARGISNCSLVLSLVSDGYARSEWCLKELALAKLLRKPVLGLIIDEGTGASMAPLESLIPKSNLVPFHDFITGRHEQESPRAVLFDIDDALFANRWQVTRPLLVSVMKDGRRIEEEDDASTVTTKNTIAYSNLNGGMGGGHGQRKMTVVQEEKNENDDDELDQENNGNVANSNHDRRRRRSSGALTPAAYAARLLANHRRRKQPEDENNEEKREEQHVLLFSPLGGASALLKKLREDLKRVGFACGTLDLATNSDQEVQRQLAAARNVVFLIEARAETEAAPESNADGSNGPSKTKKAKDANTKCARKQVSDALSRVLRIAAFINSELERVTKDTATATGLPKVLVLPVVVQRNFLDLSKMYSLARSELYYFMDDSGALWKRSAGVLLTRLQREQDSHRLRIGQ